MGSKILYQVFETEKSQQEVTDTVAKSMVMLGGQVQKYGANSIHVINGKTDVQFGFSVDIDATITITSTEENKYGITCNINWKLNALSWICLVIGLFVFGILWVIPILALFVDPAPAYNKALIMAATQMGAQTSMMPFSI